MSCVGLVGIANVECCRVMKWRDWKRVDGLCACQLPQAPRRMLETVGWFGLLRLVMLGFIASGEVPRPSWPVWGR